MTAIWTALGALLVALITGGFGIVASTRANKPAESNAQLAWVKQAQDEATDARTEAREAKAESAAARKESAETREQGDRLRREFSAMQDWVDRVVRARDAYLADSPAPDDSGIIRLLRAINGGPHFGADQT